MLSEVIQQMLRLLEQNKKQALPPTSERVTESTAIVARAMSHSPQSCILNGSTVAQHSSYSRKVESGGLDKSVMSKCNQNLACGDHCVTGKEVLQCQTSDCGSANSVVEDGDGDIQPRTGSSDQSLGYNILSVHGGRSKIDVNRIRETLKRRRCDNTAANKKLVEAMDDGMDSKAWIERELENGIELESAYAGKIQRRRVL
ncbi:hypothetical protein L1049_025691 [Liquidambar formosana]|uniref:Uncharacterized protein n=1 Tax=Liquidambar formosana TaxID=63359 RepID=A0AAP0R4T1_LIQFO